MQGTARFRYGVTDADRAVRLPCCLRQERSASRAFDGVAELLQGLNQGVPVFALNFYHPLLDGSAGATAFFESTGQIAELIRGKQEAANGGDAAAFSAFGLTADPDNTVAGRLRLGLFTEALILGLTASRAEPAVFGCKN